MVAAVGMALAQLSTLGPSPAVFKSTRFGVTLKYPRDWTVDSRLPRRADPAGLYLHKPPQETLIFRARSPCHPICLVELRESPQAKRDLSELIAGHPKWWVSPYPLDTAGTSLDSMWRHGKDPTTVDGHRAILWTDLLDSPPERDPNLFLTDSLYLDFEGPRQNVFRLIATAENMGTAQGKGKARRERVSDEEYNALLHQEMLLFREIAKTIRVDGGQPSPRVR